MTNSIQKAIVLCLISMGVSGLMAQTVNTVSEFKVEVQKTGAIIQPTMNKRVSLTRNLRICFSGILQPKRAYKWLDKGLKR